MPKKIAKILIVEDDTDLVTIFSSAFEAKGYEVQTSLNGLDGISKAASFKPDLILLDIMMPQMDGYELLKALKENTSLDTIVVINSNLEQEEDVAKAMKMGANHYFKKSRFTPFKIVEEVGKILKAEPKKKADAKSKKGTQAELYPADRQKAIKGGAKGRVMIIEDDKDLVSIFRSAFESKGFQVEVSEDGLDGISKAAKFKPDLILTDIMMPQMDGYELLKAIKDNTNLNAIVVVNSNLEQDSDIQKAKKLGADHYFKKSRYTPYHIVKEVAKLLGVGE